MHRTRGIPARRDRIDLTVGSDVRLDYVGRHAGSRPHALGQARGPLTACTVRRFADQPAGRTSRFACNALALGNIWSHPAPAAADRLNLCDTPSRQGEKT
jgi:hypothetical protein